jgi:hypothetical protein
MSRKDLTETELADDILWGVEGEKGIARYLKKKPHEVYYLIKKGLPVKKHGHRIITSTRSQLRRYFTPTE